VINCVCLALKTHNQNPEGVFDTDVPSWPKKKALEHCELQRSLRRNTSDDV
jgi:hypothetical protein